MTNTYYRYFEVPTQPVPTYVPKKSPPSPLITVLDTLHGQKLKASEGRKNMFTPKKVTITACPKKARLSPLGIWSSGPIAFPVLLTKRRNPANAIASKNADRSQLPRVG